MKRIYVVFLLAAGALAAPRPVLAGCGDVCSLGGGPLLSFLGIGAGVYLVYRFARSRMGSPPAPKASERESLP